MDAGRRQRRTPAPPLPSPLPFFPLSSSSLPSSPPLPFSSFEPEKNFFGRRVEMDRRRVDGEGRRAARGPLPTLALAPGSGPGRPRSDVAVGLRAGWPPSKDVAVGRRGRKAGWPPAAGLGENPPRTEGRVAPRGRAPSLPGDGEAPGGRRSIAGTLTGSAGSRRTISWGPHPPPRRRPPPPRANGGGGGPDSDGDGAPRGRRGVRGGSRRRREGVPGGRRRRRGGSLGRFPSIAHYPLQWVRGHFAREASKKCPSRRRVASAATGGRDGGGEVGGGEGVPGGA